MSVVGSDSPLREGSVVAGTYILGPVLGSGGHGTVFEASHARTGAKVALKVLDTRDEATVQRFLREAKLVMRLSHPAIVRVLDAGVGDDRLPYAAYERLVGASLERWLTGGPLGEARALDVVRPLLGALGEVHRAGIVHRDVKPENVFVCREPGEGATSITIKLLDFGVAKTALSTSVRTAAGLVLGTPLYMAPEQMVGEAIGPWTDLYAVGLVLAELLSGRPVFEPSLVALIRDKTTETPIALDPLVLASPLAGVVSRAIDRWPARRYASAEDMLQAIDAALASRNARATGASARPKGRTEPMAAYRPAPASSNADALAATVSRDELERLLAAPPLAVPPEPGRPVPSAPPEAAPPAEPSAPRSRGPWLALGLALFVLACAAAAYGVVRSVWRAPPPGEGSARSSAADGEGSVQLGPAPSATYGRARNAGVGEHIACPAVDDLDWRALRGKLPEWARVGRQRHRDGHHELLDQGVSFWLLDTSAAHVARAAVDAKNAGFLALSGSRRLVLVDAPADLRESTRQSVCR